MKILLVGNGYYLNIYCKYLHLLNESVEVYVVSTSNNLEDLLTGVQNIKTERELLKIVKDIDVIYYLDDNTIPQKLQERLESNRSIHTKIKHIYLTRQKTRSYPIANFNNKPFILILSDGSYNCCSDFELQLIECFYSKNVHVSCSVSEELSNVITAFEDIIKSAYIEYLNSQNDIDLVMVSIDSRSLFDDYNLDALEFIKNISPDFVIFCEEKIGLNKREKINILQYRCGLSVDMVVYSEYITYNNEYGGKLCCKQMRYDSFNTFSYSIQQNAGKIAVKKIIDKLYMPPEIKRIMS